MKDNVGKYKFLSKSRKIISAVLKNKYFWFLLILAMMIFALAHFDLKEAFESLKKIPWWAILLVIALQTVAQFVLYYQWYIVTRASGVKVKYLDMCYINSQGYIVESVTPGAKIGGEITRAIQIKNFGKCEISKAISAVALQKLFSIGVFLVITLFSVSYMIGKSLFFDSAILRIAIYCLLVLVLVFIILIFVQPRRIKNRFFTEKLKDGKQHKVREFMASMLDTVISIRNHPKLWFPILLLCAFDWLIYPLNLIIIAQQVMPSTDILFLTGAVFVAYVVAMLPIFPGGLGGFESTLTGLLVLGNFSLPDALCIAIVFRLTSFWYTILLSSVTIGLYKIFHGGRKNGQKNHNVDSERPNAI